MKIKHFSLKSLTILLMLVSIFFFAGIFALTPASDATIEAVSGNTYVLTASIGNSLGHYFKDNGNNSTLVGSKISDEGGSYYSIVSNTGLSANKTSSGYAVVRTTNDINALIEKGVVYARATFSFKAGNDNSASNLKVTLSQGGSSVSVTTNSDDELTEYKTELIKLNSTSNEIRFDFTTLTATSSGSYSDFVLYEPTIKLYTQISEIEFSNTDSLVSAGNSVKLNATNAILQTNNVSGNFLNYSKVNHAIVYKITSGASYAEIIGNYLYINSDAPDGTQIVIKAKTRANSFSNNYIESQSVTFTVSDSQVEVKVRTDFENPPTIIGEGVFTEGRRIFLRYIAQENFVFEGWFVNGELKSQSANFSYVVTAGDDIYAKFIKEITIKSIGVNNKVYDGTTNINQEDIIYNFDGVEEGHEVYFTGADIYFSVASAGTNRAIAVDNMEQIVLAGRDTEFYRLTSQLVPQSYADILPRDVIITPNQLSKQYGDSDPRLTYSASGLIAGDSLTGSLAREQGEEVGLYAINLGTLANSNYTITLADGDFNFTITARQLAFSQFYVEDKVYDQTADATIVALLTNIQTGEDVSVAIQASFDDANAGSAKTVTIDSITLQGNDKDNYVLPEYEKTLQGRIAPRPITVTANNVSIVYGSQLNLTYSLSEPLLPGDKLSGSLEIDGKDVGTYTISLGTVANPNYSITFVSGRCEITPKELFVFADEQEKEYGDQDPSLTYQTEGLVEGDSLNGSLSRETGEEIGSYQILQGTLNNINYNIIFQQGTFSIVKRNISVQISFADKVYDGTNAVSHNVVFSNALFEGQFLLNIEAHAKSSSAGQTDIEVSNFSVDGEGLDNYNFSYSYNNMSITISRRPLTVTVDPLSKAYGDEDPAITYIANGLVDGEVLIGSPKRNVGEIAGTYTYYLDDLNNENNPNYNITLASGTLFTILPRTIEISVDTVSKIYGDEDPLFTFTLTDNSALQFEDTKEGLLDQIVRQSGENVGIYSFSVEGGNENYAITFANPNFIISKRPVTVIADDATKVYGDEDPNFTYSATNTVEGEPVTISIKRQYGENVGEYEMVLESSNDPRYEITFVPGVLNITPSKITLRAESKVKIYGDEDPYFDAVITEGLLKNNDVLSNIIEGEMTRESGENVGSYQITQGSYSLGSNYIVTFIPGTLEIAIQDIEVTANASSKQYGNTDPAFAFTITSGELKFNDSFVGSLTREEGEELGQYQILQGTLAINDNYRLTFVSNTFTIEKRVIEIVPQVLSKYYGEEEPELSYLVVGSLVEGDKLDGEIYREKPTTDNDPYLYEDVGSYRIYSTLSNENYQIIFGTYYFEVMPRVIEIRAEDASKTYGEEDPELSYSIVSGEILEGDSLTGEIYRVSGENAGNYDIRSSLTLGRNYTIVFTRGTFTIKPIELVIETENYTKTYGQMDPVFSYKIVEGELINNDILYGSITRESGEDAGVYKILSNLSNINYSITIEEAYLLIERKDVYMLASVYDKIYDGTDTAVIKTPVVSGLVDKNVALSYDRNNCARFESTEVGNNWKVTFRDIILVGDKANNYNLILPEDVTGSITYRSVSDEEEIVIVEALDTAVFYQGTSLNFNNFSISREEMGLNKYQVISGFEIWLENDGEEVSLQSTITLTIKVDPDFADRNNIYVYHKTANGDYVLVNSQNNNGVITISIDELGEFVLLTDNDAWIDIVSYVCLGVLGLFLLGYSIYLVRNKKKTKKYEDG